MSTTDELLKRMPYLTKNSKAQIEVSPTGTPYNAAVPVSNRKMQIVIPTHQRPERQITLKSLSPELQQEALVLTSSEEDAKAIRKNYRELFANRHEQVLSIESLTTSKVYAMVNSIATKRQWIIENIGATAIFQMDDDMYFFARCPLKDRKLVNDAGSPSWVLTKEAKAADIKLLGKGNLTNDSLTGCFRSMQEKFLGKNPAKRFAHVGLSSRMGNNQEDMDWKVIGRMMHALGHRRDVLIDHNIRFDEVQLREDFNVTLRLLSLALPNIIYYDFCCSPSDYGAAGGCTDERTLERNNQQAELLASMYPNIVKAVDKVYDFSGSRKEVQVNWLRCFQSALAKKKANARKSLF